MYIFKNPQSMKNSQAFPFKNSVGLQSAFSTHLEQHHFGEEFFSIWTYDKLCKNPLLIPPLLYPNKARSIW